MLRSADRPFIVVREEALCLMCEGEARIMRLRRVEKVASALSVPDGGSVSHVLGLDAVVLGDGGVSSGAVGRYVSAGDVPVSEGGDTDVNGVDPVVSGDVCGCLCYIDRVSQGDTVMRVDEMALSGGGGDAVSSVDEYVCGVNSMMSAGVLDLCGVDEPVCGVSSVMIASELDVCGCDSVMSDEARYSSGVELVLSIDDAVRVGGWLSVVGDTLVCGAGVAQSHRGDTDMVVGPGVVQPGWVDGLICADVSLRPWPPPMHAMCLCRMLLAAAC